MSHCYLIDKIIRMPWLPSFRVEPAAPGGFPLFTPGYDRLQEELRPKGIYDLQILDRELPADVFPTVAIETSRFKTLPDILCIGWLAFSDNLRALIEEFEPGVHQFSPPVAVYRGDGRPAEKTYYCFNSRANLMKTLIDEKCTWRRRSSDNSLEPGAPKNTLVVDASLVKGRHFWLARDYHNEMFCSKIFAERLIASKIKKWDLIQQRLAEDDHSNPGGDA